MLLLTFDIVCFIFFFLSLAIYPGNAAIDEDGERTLNYNQKNFVRWIKWNTILIEFSAERNDQIAQECEAKKENPKQFFIPKQNA